MYERDARPEMAVVFSLNPAEHAQQLLAGYRTSLL